MMKEDPERGLDDLFLADTAGTPERAAQSTGPAEIEVPDPHGDKVTFTGAPRVQPSTWDLWMRRGDAIVARQTPAQEARAECNVPECTAHVNPSDDTCAFGHIQEIQ